MRPHPALFNYFSAFCIDFAAYSHLFERFRGRQLRSLW